MAKADGVISKNEINTIDRLMQILKLDNQDKQAAIKIFNNAKSDQYSIYDYADQYQQIANHEMREMAYTALWNVAFSDNILHSQEDTILKSIPKNLGINNNIYYRFKNENIATKQQGVTQCYELLECSSKDSDITIKKCYKRAIIKYHPDKIQSQGLPKEFIKFANEQTKKINEAYDKIKKDRLGR